MHIATWNINGIKARLDDVIYWLKTYAPDVVALQEIKSSDETFPRTEIEDLGYNVETHGQKGFNGVALLSKQPFDEVNRSLPGDENDQQARFIEGVISRPHGADCSSETGSIRIAGLYLPNGNPVESDKFPYKLAWMDRLIAWTTQRLTFEEPLVLLGDYNIIPKPEDCHNPKSWWGDALYCAQSLEKFRTLENLGLVDAVRACTQDQAYTFWDFQAGAWRRNHGIRIDHLMLSAQASDRLIGIDIHKNMRGRDKPSDHVPVVGHFDF